MAMPPGTAGQRVSLQRPLACCLLSQLLLLLIAQHLLAQPHAATQPALPPQPTSHHHLNPHTHMHISRQVREVRLVRREGRSSVCLVLLRFESQLWADDFFRDFNGKPVSRGGGSRSG